MLLEHGLLGVGSFAIGLVVGSTSLGGFLLVPLMLMQAGMTLSTSVLISLLSFVPSGMVNTYQYACRKCVDVKLFALLLVSSLPGSYLGVYWSHAVSATASRRLLGCFLLVTGAFLCLRLLGEIKRRGDGAATSERVQLAGKPGRILLFVALGVMAGLSSTLAGVGGAVVFVPVVIALGMTPAIAVGTGILTSTGIAAFGVLGHLLHLGSLPILVTILVVISFSAGTIIGSMKSEKWSKIKLNALVTLICLATGIGFIVNNL
ncbi:MAG TPA: sulfite exporter TauE/SafE family protein [Candidatus Sumerlaeota bacterium]|nr:sulfite exporter TauE/SafE family protein [Candidatus Sumerlaeota bacterium]